MPPKPTFFFVPGAWHTPIFYQPVISYLKEHGYESIAINLPSVDSHPPKRDLSADVKAIQEGVSKLVDAGRHVIVVLHSYSGIPGTEALESFGINQRKEKQKQGGVSSLVYMAAYAPLEGFRPLDFDGDAEPFPMAYEENGQWILKSSAIHSMVHNDLSAEESASWAKHFKPQSPAVFQTKTTVAAWREIPVTYLLCEIDKGLPPEFQESMIQSMEKQGANVKTERVLAGHSPFLSQPRTTGDVLRRAAGENF